MKIYIKYSYKDIKDEVIEIEDSLSHYHIPQICCIDFVGKKIYFETKENAEDFNLYENYRCDHDIVVGMECEIFVTK